MVTEKDAEQAVVDAIPAAIRSLGPPAAPPNNNLIVEGDRKYSESRVEPSPALAFVRSRVDLADGKIPATEFGRLIAHSYTANGGWYVMVVPDRLSDGVRQRHPDHPLLAVELRPACPAGLLWRGVLCRGIIGSRLRRWTLRHAGVTAGREPAVGQCRARAELRTAASHPSTCPIVHGSAAPADGKSTWSIAALTLRGVHRR